MAQVHNSEGDVTFF